MAAAPSLSRRTTETLRQAFLGAPGYPRDSMRTAPRVILLVVVVFSVLSMHEVRAQTGEVVVSSDLELLSLGDISGGGRVTWLLTGEQASELRTKIIQMYDEKPMWPRGFTYECQITTHPSVTPPRVLNNQALDVAEATMFLAHLENELEGGSRPLTGTDFRFVRITRADRAEQDLPADQSSSGLVGTTINTTQNIEIRFIFNAGTRSPGRSFDQMNESIASAVHNVFSFDAFDYTSRAGCQSPWSPFPAVNGWWRVPPNPNSTFGPGDFLWHGNRTAGNRTVIPWVDLGAYPTDAANATSYSEDIPIGTPTRIDLRFATRATMTFDHTGGAAPGDLLLVQVRTQQSSWTNLTATNDGDGDPAVDAFPPNVLGSSSFDLSPWLGELIYVRLLFTANGDATTGGTGYFVRNIRVQAPSLVTGLIDHRHIDFVVGFLSFSDFRTTDVGAHLIRTPAGEIMFYNARYTAGNAPSDQARFATFDFLENPQILFVLLVVAAWLIGLFQSRFYERFRIDHPAKMRAGVEKTKWLHWTGRIVILLLVLFYFFPTVFGAGLFISGAVSWGLSIGSAVGVSAFTWFWYDRRGKRIPPVPELDATVVHPSELPPPQPTADDMVVRLVCAHCDMDIDDVAHAYRCQCGNLYNRVHAAELGTCGNCARTLDVVPEPGESMVTIKCPFCGELQVLEERTVLKVTRCENCHMVLEEIPPRYNYLVITEQPVLAYDWFKAVVKAGTPGLVMSTTFPEKLKREFDLPEGAELYWLSDTSPGPRTLDPRRLDFEIMRALSNFVKNNKGGALVIDGLEYLVVENSFDRVLKFIKKVNDLASVHDATMFVPITPTGLGPEEMTLLRKEFDKVETVPTKT